MKLDISQHKLKVMNYFFYHDQIGYNYRMTNLQAAMGIAQLEQIEKFINIKQNNYIQYKNAFDNGTKYTLLPYRKDIRPNYWFYSLISNEEDINIRDFIDKMREKNTQVRPIWGLIHLQVPYYNSQKYMIEKADYYVNRVINIPCSSNLTSEDVDLVIERILSI